MKAFVLPDEDTPAAVRDISVPEPGSGEIRVAVKASSVNGFDVFAASGMAKGMMEHRYPVVLGKDFAGVVGSLGEGVERFAVGDEVTGIAPPEQHLGVAARTRSSSLSRPRASSSRSHRHSRSRKPLLSGSPHLQRSSRWRLSALRRVT